MSFPSSTATPLKTSSTEKSVCIGRNELTSATQNELSEARERHVFPLNHLILADFTSQFRRCFQIWQLGGVNIGRFNHPIYCEIVVPPSFENKKSAEMAEADGLLTPWEAFWKYLASNQPSVLQLFKQFGGTKPRNQVFIPAEIAHARGWFFEQLFTRPQYMKALFVAFMGRRNTRLCAHCITTYTKTITAAREHVMFPFSECVSLPGAQQNDCANCIWVAASDCDYRRLPGYSSQAKDKGCINHPFAGVDSDKVDPDPPCPPMLTLKTAPRIACRFPYPMDCSKAEKKAAEKDVVEELTMKDVFI
jgi:hypothetical protein